MHRPTILLSVFLLTAVAAAADPLDAVFARIDAAAKTFKGMTADISDTQHTALVDENDVQTGTIKLLRVKPDVTRLLVNLKGSGGTRTIALDGQEAKTYNPKTNTLDVFPLASRQGLVNQVLLLGFGATSAELKANYDVSYGGAEKIGAQATSRIVLVPKSPEMRRDLKQAELWIGENGLAVQQKFLRTSGDYQLATYTNVKSGGLPERDLELKPKGAIIQKH